MKRDYRVRFPQLGPEVSRDSRVFVHSFIMDVIKYANVLSVDELSERVQIQYQVRIFYMLDVAVNILFLSNNIGKCESLDAWMFVFTQKRWNHLMNLDEI